MPDELVSGLLKASDLRLVLATTGALSRQARASHQSMPASAALLSQGLTAAALMGALRKGTDSRINLQLECDGPLRGLFVDGDANGVVRGYVKNTLVEYVGTEGHYHWRPVLGNHGFLSVLRDQGGGEYYRSSVELEHFDLVADLERYFHQSDQVPSHLLMTQLPGVVDGQEDALGTVVGLLVQPLPNGDKDAFHALGTRLRAQFETAVRAHARDGALTLLRSLVPEADLEVMSRYPLRFTCSCSRDRVKLALLAMGREELQDLLEKEGQAEATCQFCTTRYVIPGAEIQQMLTEGSA
ncbi:MULTISPECIES: Hsp33 family molecular chaperone HslO [Corallococcus]|uniref:Hsp33 family molecular chaperone HslO n=1 Tax=Corallococcus TaxID=83461 RepID=UPI0011802C6F|nr:MULTISPECIES: Hsp33 family molecular chaperone HslO [Corallococcus]NBD07521.1 Hsp33 family molecular chaperone HslO [Corallococcus silvisoli]TSC33528.1 Hsp33 family molecular chaperone HslO [Corallococcus sp. Z5C101001]